MYGFLLGLEVVNKGVKGQQERACSQVEGHTDDCRDQIVERNV